ncbi:uncharacterized protein MYCGRDRAFT_102020 [Zymoseptoria tritici IPO323]|uniref:Uncharacterized protein n=1 Tax=Zymoseptoria tritici (strain CBS 115943 / IPO323) TaxID=336722 RepID=F9WXJ5_ZYMTI|nr:uncharacterized protein MYCGRDRAFT_102020 [Zymoseptoria tritici IPO323]EGP90875.1 hypothetical protein MYCGRDRAFT_102020 [Zymoseptoria tritici IPO323]
MYMKPSASISTSTSTSTSPSRTIKNHFPSVFEAATSVLGMPIQKNEERSEMLDVAHRRSRSLMI